MTDILVDEYGQRVYVAFETGPRVFRWIDASGMTGVQLVDPGVEPWADHESAALQEQREAVLVALHGRRLPKVAREALAEALDVHPDAIGRP